MDCIVNGFWFFLGAAAASGLICWHENRKTVEKHESTSINKQSKSCLHINTRICGGELWCADCNTCLDS